MVTRRIGGDWNEVLANLLSCGKALFVSGGIQMPGRISSANK